MLTRRGAATEAVRLLRHGAEKGDYEGKWHFGRVELRALLDAIYDGPPAAGDELPAKCECAECAREERLKRRRWRDKERRLSERRARLKPARDELNRQMPHIRRESDV